MTEQQCECDPLDHGIDCPLRMPDQHECDWEFVVPYYKGAEKVFIVCRHTHCKMVLTKKMAVAMLNKYETLNRRESEFAQFRARIRGMLPQPSNPAVSNQWIFDSLAHVIKEYETLKKENEALKPAWVCEFCFSCLLEGDLPADWGLVFLSAICPSCQKKVAEDGGYHSVPGGSYSDGRKDPRAYANIRKGKND